MPRILLFIVTVIIATHCLHAAPEVQGKTEEAELQDRIDRRAQEIATMAAYSVRLQRILFRAGFPPEEMPAHLSLEQKLDHVFSAAQFNGTRLADALNAVSRAAKIDLSIDWKSLEEAGVDKNTLVTCNLRSCSTRAELQAILDAVGSGSVRLEYLVENGRVNVTTAETAAKHVLTRTYDVIALFPPYVTREEGAEQVGKLVTDTVAPETWVDSGGTSGTLKFTGGQMVVTTTAANHAAIESLLEELDVNKRVAHRRAIVDGQESQIVALSAEIDKRVARCRSVGISVPLRLDRAMERELPDIEFIGTPLSTCFESLRSASGQIIYVNWKQLATAGIDGRMPIMLSLHRQTLAAALQSLIDKAADGNAKIQFGTQDNAITVSTPEDFKALTVARVYDIRDILMLPHRGSRQEVVDQIAHDLTDAIDPESWRDNGGAVGALRELQGQLIITQSDKAHARIKTWLDLLRHRRKLSGAAR